MGFLDITFIEDEKELNKCVEEFNDLCDQGQYPEILEWTHYELAKRSNLPDTTLWKKFLLNPKIKDWYQSEKQILLNAEVQKLIRTAAKSGSTATVQTLNSLLAQQKSMEEQTDNKKIIIYNFIPLTEEEKKDENIHENKTIPAGIRRAITIIKDETNNSN